MNIAIFDDWFNNEFIPVVRKYLRSIGLEEKAVLVLDNAPAHVTCQIPQRRSSSSG